MSTRRPPRLIFANGTTIHLPVTSRLTDIVVGLDSEGNLVAEDSHLPGFRYPLTPCCHASGKGWMDDDGTATVVCRSCYEEVGFYFGGPAEVAVPRV